MGLRPIDKGPGGSGGGGGGGGELPDGFLEYVQTIATNATNAKNTANAAKTKADAVESELAQTASKDEVLEITQQFGSMINEVTNRTEALKLVDEYQATIIAEKATQADIVATVIEAVAPVETKADNAMQTATSAALDAAEATTTAEGVYDIASEAGVNAEQAKTLANSANTKANTAIEELASVSAVADAALPANDVEFAIVYPNGGTPETPGYANASMRLTIQNPFPGHAVMSRIEVLYNNVWGDPGFTFNAATFQGYGLRVTQIMDGENFGDLVMQAGSAALLAPPSFTGSPHEGASGSETLLPFRLVVWRVKA